MERFYENIIQQSQSESRYEVKSLTTLLHRNKLKNPVDPILHGLCRTWL